MRTMEDASIFVREWLLGIQVYQDAVLLLLDFTISNALERGLYFRRLRAKRIIEAMGGVWILGQYDIFARSSQARHIGLAGRLR